MAIKIRTERTVFVGERQHTYVSVVVITVDQSYTIDVSVTHEAFFESWFGNQLWIEPADKNIELVHA